jgi:twitching motility two-component system response regulator PilH
MKTILVAEDSHSQREMMSIVLRNHDFKVITACHGEDALAKILRYNPDLVILDVVMPKINGYEVCRILRRNPMYRHLPILFCSTQASEADKYWGLKQGADAYIGKPFRSQDLLTTVDSLLLQNHTLGN